MVRTQLYLDEGIHRRLRSLARRQGRSISDLVREALTRTYGAGTADERASTLRGIEGIWRERGEIADSSEYVRQLRRDTHRVRRPAR